MKWNAYLVGFDRSWHMAESKGIIGNTATFFYSAHYELLVYPDASSAVLSVPAIGSLGTQLQNKDLLAVGEVTSDGKFTEREHLEHLHFIGAIDTSQALLVLGARNNLVNLRCPIVLYGQVHAVKGEDPLQSRRPYYGLGFENNRFVCEIIMGEGFNEFASPDFFCAGIPVLWDGIEGDELLNLILCEAADHSHVFDLPRGNNPQATDATRTAWQSLQTVFIEQLYSELPVAATALCKVLDSFNPPLTRCDDYFHAVYGVREDGALVCLFAQGRLEALGQIMRQRGCSRAVCLENSGSIMPTFVPNGLDGESIPLLRVPNFRPKGRAIIVIVFPNAIF